MEAGSDESAGRKVWKLAHVQLQPGAKNGTEE